MVLKYTKKKQNKFFFVCLPLYMHGPKFFEKLIFFSRKFCVCIRFQTVVRDSQGFLVVKSGQGSRKHKLQKSKIFHIHKFYKISYFRYYWTSFPLNILLRYPKSTLQTKKTKHFVIGIGSTTRQDRFGNGTRRFISPSTCNRYVHVDLSKINKYYLYSGLNNSTKYNFIQGD